MRPCAVPQVGLGQAIGAHPKWNLGGTADRRYGKVVVSRVNPKWEVHFDLGRLIEVARCRMAIMSAI